MNKKLIILLLIMLCGSSLASAESKQITLKDGSVIKGELMSYQNGIYSIRTENLGRLDLPERNVVSIANQGAVMPQAQVPMQMPGQGQMGQAAPMGQMGQMGQGVMPNFSNRVNSVQSQIMNNPQAMQAVAAMANDPEIASMMSDPNFVKELTAAMSSNDPQVIANNPNIQKLMNNPHMQALIRQMQASGINARQ